MRLALNPGGSTWRLTVNGANPGHILASRSLESEVTALGLRWGDVLLLNSPPAPQSNGVELVEEWLLHSFQSNRVAVNLIHGYSGVDMFSVPAYHWSAPFGAPSDLAKAAFFREGKLLGRGAAGFEEVLRQIHRDRPKQIFFLGSLYNMDTGLPPDPTPYPQDQFDSELRKSGTDFIRVEPLPSL